MRNLQIAFSRPKSKWAFISYLVRWCESTEFSHVSIRWRSESYHRDLVYQASHGMVHFMEGGRFDKEAETVSLYEIELTEEQFLTTMRQCIDLAGTKYGIATLFGIGFERITGIKSPFRDGSKSFVCSELVGELLKISEGTADIDLELAGPKELEVYVAALPNTKKIK